MGCSSRGLCFSVFSLSILSSSGVLADLFEEPKCLDLLAIVYLPHSSLCDYGIQTTVEVALYQEASK